MIRPKNPAQMQAAPFMATIRSGAGKLNSRTMAMSESVGDAIALVQAPGALIEGNLTEFAKILPASIRPEMFGRWALSVLKQGLSGQQADAWSRILNPTNPAGLASVMSALLDAASLGLEPGREYHLVPFGGTVTGITDYKGEIRLITNAVRESVVVAQLVRKGDEFYMTGANIPPRHDADWFADDRGEITGGYAFVDYGGRCSQVVRMSETQFLHHRDKARTRNVWDEWPEAMRVKTLVHQLRKLVPWSAERMWS